MKYDFTSRTVQSGVAPHESGISAERKKAVPSWNKAGDLQPAVVDTEFGKIGIVICADSYTPENGRVVLHPENSAYPDIIRKMTGNFPSFFVNCTLGEKCATR